MFHVKIWLWGKGTPHLCWQSTLKVTLSLSPGWGEGRDWSFWQLWSQAESVLCWMLLAVSLHDCTFCAAWSLKSETPDVFGPIQECRAGWDFQSKHFRVFEGTVSPCSHTGGTAAEWKRGESKVGIGGWRWGFSERRENWRCCHVP